MLRSLSAATSDTSQKVIDSNVSGLSENCMKIPSGRIGPNAGKDKEYKNPEYFCYDKDSFGEAEVELEKFRLPAPSNKKAFKP